MNSKVLQFPKIKKPNEINITACLVAFVKEELSVAELGKEVAKKIAENANYASDLRLQRIHSKFTTVTEKDDFDRFFQDLNWWCDYSDVKLVYPGGN